VAAARARQDHFRSRRINDLANRSFAISAWPACYRTQETFSRHAAGVVRGCRNRKIVAQCRRFAQDEARSTQLRSIKNTAEEAPQDNHHEELRVFGANVSRRDVAAPTLPEGNSVASDSDRVRFKASPVCKSARGIIRWTTTLVARRTKSN